MTSRSNSDSTRQPGEPAVTAEGQTFASNPRRLRYVEHEKPTRGGAVEVATGVHWARIPLPVDLNHINVWLIDVGDGCIVVDTGIAVSMGKEAWELIAQNVFASKPLRGVFVTHIHPDHIGLAAWLQARHGVPVLMSRRTFETATMMLDSEAETPLPEVEHFFRSNGVSNVEHLLPMFKPARFIGMTSGLPEVDHFVANEQVLHFSADWTAMETNGHAEGHLCLSNPDAGVLISGDQVLPTISPNISFNFRNRDLNPLGSYLSSLERLRLLPEETLVLPSHGVPFRGLQQRVDDLRDHHHEHLTKVAQICSQPKTAADLLPVMFRRELKGIQLFLALGEALAHLEYLVHDGRLERQTSAGLVRYVAASAERQASGS